MASDMFLFSVSIDEISALSLSRDQCLFTTYIFCVCGVLRWAIGGSAYFAGWCGIWVAKQRWHT